MSVFGFREEAWVTVDDVEVLAITANAVLIDHEDLAAAAWIPFSTIDKEESRIGPASARGDTGTLILTASMAKTKGLD